MARLEDETVFKFTATFQDIIDLAPKHIQKYYYDLSRARKDEFIQENFRDARRGFEFGLCDPIDDVIKVIGGDLKYSSSCE